MSERDTLKEKLIAVTIELICEGKKPSEMTVADITEKAGVGNGMVNYHFQSKDNLMRTSIKRVMVCAKKTLAEKIEPYKNAPATERIAIILKESTEFFAKNPEICKIAILDNLENEDGTAHLLSDVAVFNECIKEIYQDNKSKKSVDNYVIAGFLNTIFLKAVVIKKETDFDFYDKIQRDVAIDGLVRKLFAPCDLKHKEDTNCD